MATTWHVPTTECPTIQAGVDSAATGDTVLVACGTYTEGAAIHIDSGICLRSETGSPDCVTIDGEYSYAGLYSESVGSLVTIEGLTITRCQGFAISLTLTPLRLDHCVVSDNLGSPAGFGSAVAVLGGAAEVADCTIMYNTASGDGGGLYCVTDSAVTITNTVFSGNQGRYGGSVYLENASPAIITECSFLGSSVSYFGGGLYTRNCSPLVSGCTFDSNFAQYYGGAVYSASGAQPTLASCTVTNNNAGQGAGVFLRENGSLTMTDCTITGNSTIGGEGGGVCCKQGSTLDATGCDISGNSATGSRGGGLFCEIVSTVELTDCTIADNDAASGGGIYADTSSCTMNGGTISGHTVSGGGAGLSSNMGSIVLDGVTVHDNQGSGGGGGGIRAVGGSLDVTGCAFLDNSATAGGGIYADACSPVLSGCDFAGNSGLDFFGGALEIWLSPATVTSCTFHGNSAPSGSAIRSAGAQVTMDRCIVAFGGTGTVAYCSFGGTVALSCTDVYGNAGGDWVECFAGQEGVNGNFSADPLFCDAGNHDFTLDSASPCVDAPGCGQVGAHGEGCGAGVGIGLPTTLVPEVTFLAPAFPNPVEGSASIRFGIPGQRPVWLAVHDVAGRRVRSLLEGVAYPAGVHTVGWNGCGDGGGSLASGVYFLRLEAGADRVTRKVALIR